ncbi:2-phospho-L-lactate guanylyltransferase [Clavibacter michiganensis]|uniref:2-phospho-L-lactate guanylyltransferase n=1 Tax=Clavibacter michiganensis TaxID=28447 RepID=A0A251XW86_9MICO|nr:2-phospho-L-lactate guanylyltransferase [Clavibacter michiganensis]
MTAVVVIAKECIPGRVKTRLHPPFTLEEAAELASSALADTLAAVDDAAPARRVLLFDGRTPPEEAAGYDVIPQVAGDLDERLAAMFDVLDGPVLLVGMDTPQLTAALLRPVLDSWADGAQGPDAWFGPANDGGFWALGLRDPDGALVRGVPMSRDDTGAVQLSRLIDAGLDVAMLPELTDVDTVDDAREAAAAAPAHRFAATLRILMTDAATRAGTTAPASPLGDPA